MAVKVFTKILSNLEQVTGYISLPTVFSYLRKPVCAIYGADILLLFGFLFVKCIIFHFYNP